MGLGEGYWSAKSPHITANAVLVELPLRTTGCNERLLLQLRQPEKHAVVSTVCESSITRQLANTTFDVSTCLRQVLPLRTINADYMTPLLTLLLCLGGPDILSSVWTQGIDRYRFVVTGTKNGRR